MNGRFWRNWVRPLLANVLFCGLGSAPNALADFGPLPTRMYANETAPVVSNAFAAPDLPIVDPEFGTAANESIEFEEPVFSELPPFAPSEFPEGHGLPGFPVHWGWNWFPDEQLYPSYLAGVKEPRLGTVFFHDPEEGWLWDSTLGGRVGLLRYGDSPRSGLYPNGIQWDVEGAGFPRLDLDEGQDLVAADFRAGTFLSAGIARWRTKLGFYHISSHLGDEFMLKNPDVERNNYSRDEIVLGLSYYPLDAVRVYAEAGWAFHFTEPADPWEFQFGLDYSPVYPRSSGPFFAANGHLRQEVNFGGNLVVQAGWQWRDQPRGPLFRAGLQYFNGMSNQLQFYNRFENQIGGGIWYDF